MQLKTNNLKFTINLKHIIAICLTLFVTNGILAQEIIDETPKAEKIVDSLKPIINLKVDGVSAVVGDYIILESDIDKTLLQLKAQGGDPSAFSRCQLFGKLLEDKLYAHHAIQDSIVINDAEIRSYVSQQLQQIQQQVGGDMQDILDFYKKADEQSLRDEMFEINKAQRLGSEMQRKIVDEIEVTPEEVRQFFNKIPEEQRPTFGTELKVAQIVIKPEPTQVEIDNVIAKLKGIKRDVEENGANFRSKALFNSDDPGSKQNGGALPPMNRARPRMVKEFREVAFALQEGEISEPFKTEYGYHIILLEKIRGQEYDVRHILMIPEVAESSVKAAKEKIELTKKNIEEGNITFAEAAREVSDEKETKFQGGQLINPATQDYNFELTKMDTEIYVKIQDLADNSVSDVLVDRDNIGNVLFKILTVTDRIDDHTADYSKDYLKIKDLALSEKRLEAIGKWQEEKILDTYIKISGDYRDCEFTNNWTKK